MKADTSHLQVAVATLKSWRTISSVWRHSWLQFTSCQSSPSSRHSTFHLQKKTTFPIFPVIFQSSSSCHFVLWAHHSNSTHCSPNCPLLVVRHKVIHCQWLHHLLVKERQKRENGKCEDVCPPSALERSSGSRGEGERLCGATAALLHVGGEEMMRWWNDMMMSWAGHLNLFLAPAVKRG